MRSFILAVLFVLGVSVGWLSPVHEAEAFKLPNYATSSNIESEIQNKGKKITNVVALVVGIVAIIGMLVGGIFYATNNPETGKRYFFGGIIAIILSSLVLTIAQLVAS